MKYRLAIQLTAKQEKEVSLAWLQGRNGTQQHPKPGHSWKRKDDSRGPEGDGLALERGTVKKKDEILGGSKIGWKYKRLESRHSARVS